MGVKWGTASMILGANSVVLAVWWAELEGGLFGFGQSGSQVVSYMIMTGGEQGQGSSVSSL